MPGEGASSGTVRSVEHADVVKGDGFAGPVADLPEDAQGLLVEVQGLHQIPPIAVPTADVVQRGGFAVPVADLPADGQGLLVGVESLLQLPAVVVREADVVQCLSL